MTPTDKLPNDLVTLSDAMRISGRSWTSVNRWIRDGSLRLYRVGGRPFVRRADAIARRKS